MIDIKEFRKRNALTQEQLAQYWGVKTSFISFLENGRSKLPKEKLTKLLNNPNGWDTSMLVESSTPIINGDHIEQNGGRGNIGKIAGDSSAEIAALRRELEIIRQQLQETKEQNEKYWKMITELIKK
jgi:transcriptional regulator with XRE-family HTH domain